MLTISSVAVAPVPPQAPAVARVQPITPGKASESVSLKNQGVAVPVAPAGEGLRAQQVYAPSSLPPVAPTGEVPRAHNFNNTATPERTGLALPAAVALAQTAVAQAAELVAAGPRPGAVAAADAGGAEQGVTRRQEAQIAPSANPTPEQQAHTLAQGRELQERFRGELPPEAKNPATLAMESQIKELLPNMWKASRAAVDVLIGDEARAAAAARAEVLAQATASGTERASEASENYTQTSQLPQPPTSGRHLDRLA